MKKLICLVLAIMLALSAVSALAEEYTFQGIPWGSTPDQVESILIEKGLISESGLNVNGSKQSTCFPYEDVQNNINDGEKLYKIITNRNKVDGIGSYTSFVPLKTIGGYEVMDLELDFLYGVNDNVIDSGLHLAQVIITFNPSEGAFDSLINMLNEKYGEYTKASNDSLKMDVIIWYGDNDSIISLAEWHPTTMPFLIYAKADDYITAQQIQAINEANALPIEDAGL